MLPDPGDPAVGEKPGRRPSGVGPRSRLGSSEMAMDLRDNLRRTSHFSCLNSNTIGLLVGAAGIGLEWSRQNEGLSRWNGLA